MKWNLRNANDEDVKGANLLKNLQTSARKSMTFENQIHSGNEPFDTLSENINLF